MYKTNPTTIKTNNALANDDRLLGTLMRSSKFEKGVIKEAKKTPKTNGIKNDDP